MARKTASLPRRLGLPSWLSTVAVVLIDAGLAWLAMLMAVRLRYDSIEIPMEADIDHKAALLAAAMTVVVWFAMKQDRAIWRFTSLADFRRLLLGVVVVMALVPLVLFLFFDRGQHFPRTAPVIGGVMFFVGLVSSRLISMVGMNGDFRALWRSPSFNARDAVLVGPASDLYNYLRDESRRADSAGFNPVGLIETTGGYPGRAIRSVPILGTPDDLRKVYPKLQARRDAPLHILALGERVPREQTRALIKIAAELGAPLARSRPGTDTRLSPFEAADLIGRVPRTLDPQPVSELFSGKRVLVTGAGGSIGSELSEQIARLAPARLALVDTSELNLFNLQQTLAPLGGTSNPEIWRTYLGDVCNAGRMSEIFKAERPEIVLHAAALKHVPLGESNPVETLRTNVLGTSVTLDMCEIYGVAHFVLISTDKAVDPVNIMGASKRVVELLTLARQSQIPNMRASAVRFGNVLGSTGSVVTLFETQIAEGGPVTVTHEKMNRYFMTVQEASSLVLQAAALNAAQAPDQAHIYVLEMGEPVNIAGLARSLIRLRGKVPDVDVDITFTGLRPGEKLSERLTHSGETLETTAVPGVGQFGADVPDADGVLARVDALLGAVERRDRAHIRSALAALLSTYVPHETLDGLPIMHDLPQNIEIAGLGLSGRKPS